MIDNLIGRRFLEGGSNFNAKQHKTRTRNQYTFRKCILLFKNWLTILILVYHYYFLSIPKENAYYSFKIAFNPSVKHLIASIKRKMQNRIKMKKRQLKLADITKQSNKLTASQ